MSRQRQLDYVHPKRLRLLPTRLVSCLVTITSGEPKARGGSALISSLREKRVVESCASRNIASDRFLARVRLDILLQQTTERSRRGRGHSYWRRIEHVGRAAFERAGRSSPPGCPTDDRQERKDDRDRAAVGELDEVDAANEQPAETMPRTIRSTKPGPPSSPLPRSRAGLSSSPWRRVSRCRSTCLISRLPRTR